MNIATAQKISTIGFLASQGYQPETISGDNVWYRSPLRPGETKPSFKVNRELNKWIDFGSGEKGDIIDLVCKINNVSTTGALLILESPDIAQKLSLSFGGQPSVITTNENRITLQHVQPLQNRALIQYIKSRGIAPGLAGRYCKEAYYTLTNISTGEIKRYFSLAFENDRHGWELRNRFFKGCISPKDITTISGTLNNVLSIFEGFFDFLAACQHFKVIRPAGTVIILNSTIHTEKVLPHLAKYDQINLYLDNDHTGQRVTNTIKEHHSGVTDFSKILYPGYKDFNEFLNSQATGAKNNNH